MNVIRIRTKFGIVLSIAFLMVMVGKGGTFISSRETWKAEE